jgi:hypothetical protein
MNSNDLREMLKLIQCREVHVLSCDELPQILPDTGWSCIVNSDPADKSGEHWLSCYVSKEKRLEFFDSLAFPKMIKKNPDFMRFFGLFESIERNVGMLQSPFSEICGLVTIMYLYYRCNENMSMKNIVMNKFTDNVLENECIVLEFISSLYDSKLYSHVYNNCSNDQ